MGMRWWEKADIDLAGVREKVVAEAEVDKRGQGGDRVVTKG